MNDLRIQIRKHLVQVYRTEQNREKKRQDKRLLFEVDCRFSSFVKSEVATRYGLTEQQLANVNALILAHTNSLPWEVQLPVAANLVEAIKAAIDDFPKRDKTSDNYREAIKQIRELWDDKLYDIIKAYSKGAKD